MSLSRVLAVARRIAQGFRRDERTLGLIFVVPIVITALLGWMIRDQKDPSVEVAVVNDAGPLGAAIVQSLQGAALAADNGIGFGTADSRDAAVEGVRNGAVDIAIVLPSSLVADIGAHRQPTFEVISAGADPGSEAASLGALQQLMATMASELSARSGAAALIPRIDHQTVYLPVEADELDVLAPVFLGYFGYFFVFMLTGISFLRERIGGTLERLLSTPVSRGEIVLGYTLGFGFFATLQVIVLTLFVLGRVDVPAIGPLPSFTIGLAVHSAGSPALAFAIALALSLGAVSLGIFLSTFARTELQVIQFIPLVIIPQGLLGGIFWPVERLPDVLQAIAHVLPLTYAVEALRAVMIKGADLGDAVVRTDLLVLAGIAAFFVVLAGATIKREVA